MVWRLGKALALCGVALASYLALGVGSASALTTEPILDPQYQEQVQSLLAPTVTPPVPAEVNPATGSLITSAEVSDGMGLADVAAGTLPELGTAAAAAPPITISVVAAAAAAYTGWEIGNFIYKKVTTDDSTAGVTTFKWQCWDNGAVGTCGGTDSISGFTPTLGTTTGYTAVYSALVDSHDGYCVPANATNCTVPNADSAFLAALPGVALQATSNTNVCGNTAAANCFVKLRFPSDMASHVTVAASNSTAFGSAATQANDKVFQVPAAATASGVVGGAQALGSGTFSWSALTPDQAGARCAVDNALVPGYQCTDTPGTPTQGITPATSFVLPEPTPTESYQSYIERLRTLGYLGTVMVVDETMDYPNGTTGAKLSPESLTSVQLGSASAIGLYNHTSGVAVPWPSAPGYVTPGVTGSITLKKVPDSYDPTAHGATAPTVGGAHPGCNCGSVDFSPLTGLSYGSKFPFGVFAWISSVTGGFTGTGTPVTFSLPVAGITQTITLSSSDWETTWRPIVFPILEFCMTLAGVWFLAFRLIGFGGD